MLQLALLGIDGRACCLECIGITVEPPAGKLDLTQLLLELSLLLQQLSIRVSRTAAFVLCRRLPFVQRSLLLALQRLRCCLALRNLCLFSLSLTDTPLTLSQAALFARHFSFASCELCTLLLNPFRLRSRLRSSTGRLLLRKPQH